VRVQLRQDRAPQSEGKLHAPGGEPPQYANAPSAELQLQLRRLELEHEREARCMLIEERERELQEREQERKQQFELKKLELQLSRDSGSPANPSAPLSVQSPPLRVEAAIKLIPKFTEHEVETFLISFEKKAELNAFPREKYAAILQAYLTGEVLKVFTELTVDECRDYPTLKTALLHTFSVVPVVYRKRFRGLSKSHAETYSEFAFRLSTQFTRWLESEGAYSDGGLLRDLIQREQFQSNLETELRVWSIDQKFKNLSEAAKLADQFVAVRKAERPGMKGHEFKPKFSAESGRSNLNTGTQNPSSISRASNVQNEQKPSAANTKYKSSSSGFDKTRVVCYYCKKPGHIMSNCTRRLAKQTSKKDSTVHLVSTFTSPHSEGLADSAVAPKPQEVDPRFKDHALLSSHFDRT